MMTVLLSVSRVGLTVPKSNTIIAVVKPVYFFTSDQRCMPLFDQSGWHYEPEIVKLLLTGEALRVIVSSPCIFSEAGVNEYQRLEINPPRPIP